MIRTLRICSLKSFHILRTAVLIIFITLYITFPVLTYLLTGRLYPFTSFLQFPSTHSLPLGTTHLISFSVCVCLLLKYNWPTMLCSFLVYNSDLIFLFKNDHLGFALGLFLFLFIYLVLAVLGLYCCKGAFAICGEQGLSLVVVHGFFHCCLWWLLSCCGAQGMRAARGCGAQAQLPHGMWHLLGSGIESTFPASAGKFFVTGPPGKA